LPAFRFHPDRLIYPDLDISKIDLTQYYERIAEWVVPHVAGRPLTLVHCPAGVAGPCHFLKHAKAWGPNALRRVRIQERTKVGEYLVADSVEGVVSLAQMGIVEIHTWNSTADDVDRPNRVVWDLDPGPLVSWKQVVKVARLVRDVLKTLGLRSWVKTTGGRGVDVVVPLKRKRTVTGRVAHMHLGLLIKGHSDVIVRDGALDEAAARRNRLSEHDVLEDLRLNGNVAEIRDMLLAVLERNGHISVVRRESQ
jgi:DNA ligase D-like protein (predicted polymerase)